MGCSNNLVGLLNTLTFLLSIPILITGIHLSNHATTICDHTLQKPILYLGLFLLIISLVGIIGACCKVNWLLWLYLFVMFVLIVAITVFTVFVFVVTNKGAGEVVSNRGYKEYRLGDYSNWLRKRVENEKNWGKIVSCLSVGDVCGSLKDGKNVSKDVFYSMHLDPIQSGCCKPPDNCNFQYMTPTTWIKNVTADITNPDCTAWNNDQAALCFNCQSCKAGVLQDLKSQWKKVSLINIVFLIFLIVVYSMGCCALRNNRWDNRWRS